MAGVAQITPEVRAIQVPAPLRELPAWLIWRYETYEGDKKPRKVPFYHSGTRRSGQQGSPEDREKLTTFTTARDAAARRGFDGVGFAPLADWGITALDFDNCVGPDGGIPAEIERIAGRTYAEYSPSGKGIRAFVRGNLGNHKAPTTSGAYGAETFASNGFVTVTGDMLPGVDLLGHEDTIAEADAHVVGLCQQRFGASSERQASDDFTAGFEPVLNLSEDEIIAALEALDPDMDREPWVRTGMGVHHETQGEGFDLWDEWSSGGAKYPGEEALRQQWDSFERRKAPGRKQVTMASVLAMVRDTKVSERRVATVGQAQAKAETLAADLRPPVGAATPTDFTGKFPVVSAASIMAQKPVDWLVKHIVPAADLGVLFGASGSGKSFVSLDLAFCIALGRPWRGHKARQGPVIIITAEGGGSYGKRIKAYCQHHGLDAASTPIGIINAAPNILEAGDIGELAASIKAMGGAALLIVDTLAQVTPGANENTSEDMGRALANAMVLRRTTGAMVLLIHHAGKDLSRGSRGWSGIKGALDVEIEVSRDEASDSREIRLTKMKDEEDGLRFAFKLETIVLGMDEDGDEYRSCVAVESELRPKALADSTLRGAGIKARGIWQMAIIEAAGLVTASNMLLEDLVSAALPLAATAEGDEGRTRQSLRRAVKVLAKEQDGPLGLVGQRVVFYQ